MGQLTYLLSKWICLRSKPIVCDNCLFCVGLGAACFGLDWRLWWSNVQKLRWANVRTSYVSPFISATFEYRNSPMSWQVSCSFDHQYWSGTSRYSQWCFCIINNKRSECMLPYLNWFTRFTLLRYIYFHERSSVGLFSCRVSHAKSSRLDRSIRSHLLLAAASHFRAKECKPLNIGAQSLHEPL
jgi:hypothetical protein